MSRQKNTEIDFEKLKDDWPSPFVARDKIEEFTQGMYKSSSLNTFDAVGKGISPRFRFGSKIFYRVKDVLKWLGERKCLKN